MVVIRAWHLVFVMMVIIGKHNVNSTYCILSSALRRSFVNSDEKAFLPTCTIFDASELN